MQGGSKNWTVWVAHGQSCVRWYFLASEIAQEANLEETNMQRKDNKIIVATELMSSPWHCGITDQGDPIAEHQQWNKSF